MLVGIYPVSENDLSNQASLNKTLMDNVQNAQKPAVSLPMTTFDYKALFKQTQFRTLQIAILKLNPKFADDPAFNLVFINNEVAIFKVKANGTLNWEIAVRLDG